jgi:outer membrane protein
MKAESLKVLMLRPRQFTSLVLSLTCALLMPLTAMAQTPVPPQQPAQQPTIQSPESPPIPERSIGLEPGKVVRWTKRDAVLAAFENSIDIELEKTNVRNAQWTLLAAQGVYDPTITPTLGYQSDARAVTRPFTGVEAGDDTINSGSGAYNIAWDHQIEKTGGSYGINFNNQRFTNNTGQLSPEYSPNLEFSITQPLFRNFRIDSNRQRIKLAQKDLSISDALFRQKVIQIIADVEAAYWNLYVAIENERIARQSLTLFEKQLSDNIRQVEVGTRAPIEITEAATTVESNRAQVFDRINQVAQAENALKALTTDGPNSDLWKAKIIPIDPFEIQSNPLPLDDAMKLATENRPEILRLTLLKEKNQVNIDFFRNQAKPQINFVAGYTLYGVGGRPRETLQPVAPCTREQAEIIDGQQFCLGLAPGLVNGVWVPQVTQIPYTDAMELREQPTADNFKGGYRTALGNLFSNNYRTWSVGLNFQLPLRNRVAKANLASSRELDRQNDLMIRQQLQNIEVEVRNAVQQVETARLRVDSTRQARVYAEQQLEGEKKKFQAGLTNTFFVLQYTNQLTQAQFSENSAIASYNIAVANLNKVIATTLSSNNIQIVDPKQPMK